MNMGESQHNVVRSQRASSDRFSSMLYISSCFIPVTFASLLDIYTGFHILNRRLFPFQQRGKDTIIREERIATSLRQ